MRLEANKEMKVESSQEKPASSLTIVRPVLREMSELRAVHGAARIIGVVPARHKALRELFCRLDAAIGSGRDCDLMMIFSSGGSPRILVRANGVAVAYSGDDGACDFLDDFSDFR